MYQTVVEYTEEAVGRLAMQLAESLIDAALADTPFDLDAALTELRDLDEDVRLGPSTGSIVGAAVARDIPYPPPDRRQHGDVRLGQPPAPHPGRRNGQHQRHRRIASRRTRS